MNPAAPIMRCCPFCGGNPTVMTDRVGTSNLTDTWIECYQCGSRSTKFCNRKKGLDECAVDAVEAWNRRVKE